MTKATPTSTKPATFFGISAKHFLTIASAEQNPAKLGDMLAFVHKRIADHKVKHPSRVKRWERVAEAITARLNSQPVAAPALSGAATFTMKPLPKGKAKAKGKKTPKAVGFDLDGILRSSGLTAEQLMLQLATRVTAK